MSRNLDILKHILTYCEAIEGDIKTFGNSKTLFISNAIYQRSVSFSLLQIGELSGKLTDCYIKLTSNEMNWRAMKGLRNLIVHDYGNINLEIIWDTITKDIPLLQEFCEMKIEEANSILREAKKYSDCDEFIEEEEDERTSTPLNKLNLS